MSVIKVLIIEDEREEADTLRELLDSYAQEHGVRFQVEWLPTAFEFVNSKRAADLVFLDIDLPGINGMEAAQDLRTRDTETPIIFVTNLAQYAVRGYEVDATAFMVKPVNRYDFSLHMGKAMRAIERRRERSVAVGTKNGLRVMPVSQIAHIDISKHNLAYHLSTGEEPFVVRGSLSEIEKNLADSSFVRISKSCLVNMAFVRRVSGPEVLLSTGETVYISRTWRMSALNAIADYYGGNA